MSNLLVTAQLREKKSDQVLHGQAIYMAQDTFYILHV